MKKTILLIVSALYVLTTDAQTPVKKNVSVITKTSATWCGPCGSWGWTASNEFISNNPNTIYIGVFPSSINANIDPTVYPGAVGTWGNGDFYTALSVNFMNTFVLAKSGYPSFATNFIDYTYRYFDQATSTINTGKMKNSVDSAAKKIEGNTNVVASTGYTYAISSKGDITVNTKTKFWAAANGTYQLAVYLVEDKALNRQNGQTDPTKLNDKTEHHSVLRTSLSGDFGDQIATGSINANQEFTKSYTFKVTNTKWDKAKLKPIVILWKVNGSKYEMVNANKTYDLVFPTGVDEVPGMTNVIVYPNPATNQTTVALALENATDGTIMITDALGRTVYNSGKIHLEAGEQEHTISTANFAGGIYNVVIATEAGISTQRLSVAK